MPPLPPAAGDEDAFPERRPFSVVTPTSIGVREVNRTGPTAPFPRRWSTASGVHPTSTWFQNLLMCDPAGDPVSILGLEVNCNVHLNPYVVWPNASGLAVAQPYVQDQGANAGNIFDDTQAVALFVGTAPLQDPAGPGWREVGYDDLTVSLEWTSANFSAPLVRGSPFVTTRYNGAHVLIASEQTVASIGQPGRPNAWCEGAGCDGHLVDGTRLAIHLAQSDETWHVYAEPALPLRVEATAGPSPEASVFGGAVRLRSERPWVGTIRLALANNCTAGVSRHCPAPATPRNGSAMAALLDAHAAVVPVAGGVRYKVGATHVRLRYSWTTERLGGSESGAEEAVLLAMMPHHTSLLGTSPRAEVYRTGLGFRDVHGFSELVVANTWDLTLPLPVSSFHAPRPPMPRFVDALVDELAAEAEWLPPKNYQAPPGGAGDPYTAGKLLSRMARTALIAEALGDADTADAVGGRLAAFVDAYAAGRPANEWVWDASWGGLVSCGCDYDNCFGKCDGHCRNEYPACPALADPGRDFGNAFYNDHHFHWGYHAYAAAVAAKFRPAWAHARRERLLLLARDIASPAADGSFPAARHKDWYAMHSWASGIAMAGGMPYRNGRNQESSSEAVNGYYGVALLGRSLRMRTVEDAGLAMLAMEVRRVAVESSRRAHRSAVHPLMPTLPRFFSLAPAAGTRGGGVLPRSPRLRYLPAGHAAQPHGGYPLAESRAVPNLVWPRGIHGARHPDHTSHARHGVALTPRLCGPRASSSRAIL